VDYPWELVLDHSYTGLPGVVFDQSPARAGHGIADGIAESDFLLDGAAPRSGAVRMRGGTRSIRADLGPHSAISGGVAIDMVCSREALEQEGTLIESEVFTVEVYPARTFQGWFLTEGGSQGFGETVPFGSPLNDWNTVSVLYDGWQFLDVSVNGELVVTFPDRGNYWPLLPGRHVAIGNRLNRTNGLRALVDDVKIWRLNPQRVDNNFRRRPVFNNVSTNWANWGRILVLIFRDDMECAAEIRRLLESALGALHRAVPNDDGYDHWESSAQEYQKAWDTNKLDKIPPIATATLHWLREQGVDPMNLPEVKALFQSRCFKKLVDRTISPDNSDPAFHNMILGIAQGY
jgi:hypothetical protein